MKKIIMVSIFCLAFSLAKPGTQRGKTVEQRIAAALKIISSIGTKKEQTHNYNEAPFQNPGQEEKHPRGCFFCCSSEDHYKQ